MREWCEIPSPPGARAALEKAGYAPLMARILASRGVSPENAEEFFSPSVRRLSPPDRLPGAERVADGIISAVRAGRKIVVFGDYDCDGICATAILVKTLETLGADVSPFIPDRLSEGYGMSGKSVARMLSENPGVSLVVTVDNGIGAAEHVAELRAKGVDVVVTDHHLPGETVPDCPIANPKVASPDDLDGLCGAGVALMVAAAAVSRARAAGLYSGGPVGGPLVVLAGLATVSDIMPLRAQNRIIVSEALRMFPKYAPAGLKELLDRASRTGIEKLRARDFGFLLGPRINAAGRLSDGMAALRLILSRDREESRALALEIDLLNTRRKSIEQEMSEKAFAAAKPGDAAHVIDIPGGHRGVAGIVASRLLEKLACDGAPAPVCIVVDGLGSGRAPEGYNIRDAFAECGDCLERFGGHAAAGGFSVKPGRLDEFRERFAAACAAQSRAAEGAAGALSFDAWVEEGDIDVPFVESLESLEPFGEGNPEPSFAMRGVYFSDIRQIGADGRHVGISFRNAPRGVWWNRGGEIERLRRETHLPHDVVFNASLSGYGGRHVEMRICAMRLSAEIPRC